MTATCWIDPGGRGAPYESVIRFTGRRLAVGAAPSAADRFAQDETVQLVPGSGPVAVTARVEGVSAGQWLVRVRPLALRAPARVLDPRCPRDDGRLLRLRHVLWTRGTL